MSAEFMNTLATIVFTIIGLFGVGIFALAFVAIRGGDDA
jgi:hypothetical protein